MKRFSAVVVFFLLCPLSAIGSTSFTNIVAFGDSLTDNGTSTSIGDTYGNGRYTDGDIWVEMLSRTLSTKLYDVAYGGATTGSVEPNLLWQVAAAIADETIPTGIGDDGTLFTIWAGANDYFYGEYFGQAVAAEDVVANIRSAMTTLAGDGATSIMVANLPDLGLTPKYYNGENELAAHAWTMAFNSELYAALNTFVINNSFVDIYYLDINSVFSGSILLDDGTINQVYWDYLFYDDVHPTEKGHLDVAVAAYEVLSTGPMSAIPVPAAAWLLGSGLVGLIALRRRF